MGAWSSLTRRCVWDVILGIHPWANLLPGMLALLVLAYPDTRFKERIQELDIGWMLEARDKLDVKQGYWSGINRDTIYTAFLPEEPRTAEMPLLLDYTRLFGESFTHWRQDVRPCLDGVHWISPLELDGPPSDIEAGPSDDEGEEEPAVQASALNPTTNTVMPGEGRKSVLSEWRRTFFPGPADTLEELEDWLANRLDRGDGEVYSSWCQHWAQRMRKEQHDYQGYSILRSLFTQSLRRLKSYATKTQEAKGEAAYMLLDMEDSQWGPVKRSAVMETAMLQIKKSSTFADWEGANANLIQLGSAYGDNVRDLLRKASTRLDSFFYKIFISPTNVKYVHEIMAFDALRVSVVMEDPDIDVNRQELARWRRDLDEKLVADLRLTAWQLRASLVSPLEDVLTDWQFQVYRDADASPLALPIAQTERHERAQGKHHKLLHALFGPANVPITETPTPSPTWSLISFPSQQPDTIGSETVQPPAHGQERHYATPSPSQVASHAASTQAASEGRSTPGPRNQPHLAHGLDSETPSPSNRRGPADISQYPEEDGGHGSEAMGNHKEDHAQEAANSPLTSTSLKRKRHEAGSSGHTREENSSRFRRGAYPARMIIKDVEDRLEKWINSQADQEQEAFRSFGQEIHSIMATFDGDIATAKKELDLAEDIIYRADAIRQVYISNNGVCSDAFETFKSSTLQDRDKAAVRYKSLTSELEMRQELLVWLPRKLQEWQETSRRHLEAMRTSLILDIAQWEEGRRALDENDDQESLPV